MCIRGEHGVVFCVLHCNEKHLFGTFRFDLFVTGLIWGLYEIWKFDHNEQPLLWSR